MDVLCFDFDGVLCDSAPETAATAWEGCRALWPATADASPALPEALRARFCRLRPVMHTGFEAIPLMRLIETDAADDAAILADFPTLRDGLVAREGLRREDLQQRFGAIRDRLIAADEAAWLGWNDFYAGAAALLRAALHRHTVFILTTKQQRFAERLLAHQGLHVPDGHLFGLEAGRSKPALLAALQARPALAGATFHFIEDRLDTLLDVVADDALAAVRLYLADWGYNTPAQRREAAANNRIQVVALDAFRAAVGL